MRRNQAIDASWSRLRALALFCFFPIFFAVCSRLFATIATTQQTGCSASLPSSSSSCFSSSSPSSCAVCWCALCVLLRTSCLVLFVFCALCLVLRSSCFVALSCFVFDVFEFCATYSLLCFVLCVFVFGYCALCLMCSVFRASLFTPRRWEQKGGANGGVF